MAKSANRAKAAQPGTAKGKGKAQGRGKAAQPSASSSSAKTASRTASGSKRSHSEALDDFSETVDSEIENSQTESGLDEPSAKGAKQRKTASARRTGKGTLDSLPGEDPLSLTPDQMALWKALNKKVQAAKAESQSNKESGK
jgi:hypothetical protein